MNDQIPMTNDQIGPFPLGIGHWSLGIHWSLVILLRHLVGQILQILLHQRPVFLRIFFRLRLLYGRAVAFGQSSELARARGFSSRAIRSAGTIPITLSAGAVRTR